MYLQKFQPHVGNQQNKGHSRFLRGIGDSWAVSSMWNHSWPRVPVKFKLSNTVYGICMDLSICFHLQHTLCGAGDFRHQRKLFGHSKGLLRKCLGVLSHLFTYLEIGVSKFKGISSCPKERIRIVKKPISVRWNENVGFWWLSQVFLLSTSLAVELFLACRLPVGRFFRHIVIQVGWNHQQDEIYQVLFSDLVISQMESVTNNWKKVT